MALLADVVTPASGIPRVIPQRVADDRDRMYEDLGQQRLGQDLPRCVIPGEMTAARKHGRVAGGSEKVAVQPAARAPAVVGRHTHLGSGSGPKAQKASSGTDRNRGILTYTSANGSGESTMSTEVSRTSFWLRGTRRWLVGFAVAVLFLALASVAPVREGGRGAAANQTAPALSISFGPDQI